MWLHSENYNAILLDIKTAFLHGKLEEEIFINIPDRYKESLEEEGEHVVDKNYLRLDKTLYGLIQAAREWWKTFVSILKKKSSFEQFQNNNCLLKQKDEAGFIAIGIYVDDCLIIGNKSAIKKAIGEIQSEFKITMEALRDFIGCTIAKRQEEILLHQPDLIKKLLRTFQDEIKITKNYKTPVSTGYKVVRPGENEIKLDD